MEPSNHVLEFTIDPFLALAFIWWTTIVGIFNETDVVFDRQILPFVSSAVYDANLPYGHLDGVLVDRGDGGHRVGITCIREKRRFLSLAGIGDKDRDSGECQQSVSLTSKSKPETLGKFASTSARQTLDIQNSRAAVSSMYTIP
jgi:hypothetical protein